MKKQSPRRKSTTARPVLTDPHLAALLMYVTGAATDDNDGRHASRFARTQASAAALLASSPVTSAFGDFIDRPSIWQEVSDSLRDNIETWLDPEDARRAFQAVEDARSERSTRHVGYKDVRDILHAYVSESVQLGACLMYMILKGGA